MERGIGWNGRKLQKQFGVNKLTHLERTRPYIFHSLNTGNLRAVEKRGEKDGDKDIQFFEFIQLILFVLFKKRPR